MINCERCGTLMPDNVVVCPSCGSATSANRLSGPPPTNYTANSGPIPEYSQGYSQPQVYNPQSGYSQQQMYNPQSGYGQQQMYNPQQQGYGQPPYNMPPVMQPPIAINVNVAQPVSAAPSSSNSAVIVEVLLNIFLGIYGVGWLMAGETTVGVILLICTFVLYWPIAIVLLIFTFGCGYLPVAIIAIVVNGILLNNTVKRKSSYVIAQPMQPFPPR